MIYAVSSLLAETVSEKQRNIQQESKVGEQLGAFLYDIIVV